jgi:hypothetical protein
MELPMFKYPSIDTALPIFALFRMDRLDPRLTKLRTLMLPACLAFEWRLKDDPSRAKCLKDRELPAWMKSNKESIEPILLQERIDNPDPRLA